MLMTYDINTRSVHPKKLHIGREKEEDLRGFKFELFYKDIGKKT